MGREERKEAGAEHHSCSVPSVCTTNRAIFLNKSHDVFFNKCHGSHFMDAKYAGHSG